MRRFILYSMSFAALLCVVGCIAIAAPPQGTAQAVFVADNSGGPHINEYTSAGVYLRTLTGAPPSNLYRGLTFGADGYLYVASTFSCALGTCNELEKFDPATGAYLGAVGSITPNTNPYSGVTNQATSLNSLALGPGNDLYVTTNQDGLYKIDPVANTTVAIPTADCCTWGVAFLPDGTPLSIGGSQNAVWNDLTAAPFTTGYFTSPTGLAFGPDGRLYVLEYHQIDTVPGSGGAYTPLTASNALSLGSFLTFDSQGNIWVTDTSYGVREFSSVTGQQIGGFASNLGSAFAGIAVGPMAGNVWGWGYNGYGQLGNGTTSESVVPVPVSNLTGAAAIAAGSNHSLTLKSDGTVWAWGLNVYGQLGNGTTTNSTTPVQVSNLAGAVAIASGSYFSLALKSDGTVWAWGEDVNGQLGNGTTTTSVITPVQVSGLSNVVAIAGGSFHSLAVRADGTVWTWGDNSNGQLGDGTTIDSNVPVQVSSLAGIVAIAGGDLWSLAVKSDGTVWAWGNNSTGQLGNGTTIDSHVPVQVSNLSGAVAVAGGGFNFSLALKSDGTVWAWGGNFNGELGNGTTTDSYVPVQVSNLVGATAISAGTFHSLALKSDGTAWSWGYNFNGELGNGTTTDSHAAVQVSNLTGVVAIAGGYDFSLAIQRQASGPGPATHFAVSAPTSATAGTAFSFTVTALNASNNTVTGYSGTVHFTSTDGSAALPSDYTFTAADGGSHVFSATVLNTPGTQSVTATDTSNSSVTGNSGAITVNPAPATHLSVSAPSSVTTGTGFNFTVTALNASNTTATGYTGTAHFTSTDSQGVLPPDYTFTAADNGVHIFNATLLTAGSQTITATDTANATITGSSNGIAVTGRATRFAVSAPASAAGGTPFSFTVVAQDASNNNTTNYTGTVHFTSSDPSAVLPADYTFTAADQGTHVFTATLKTGGNQRITATDTSNATITGASNNIAVIGLATHFAVSAPASAAGGTAFSFTVVAQDAANNNTTNYTGTVHFTSSDGLAVLPADYTFTAADQGTHVFSSTLNTSGVQTITVKDTANSTISGISSPINVTSSVPPPVQITDTETITVSDSDSFPDVFDAEAVHVTDTAFLTPLIAVGAPVAEFSAGGLGFNGQNGSQTITVSDIGQAPLTFSSATISGSAQFSITQISCSNGAASFSTQLPLGGACIVTIGYTASATPANDNATLVFTDNAALSNLNSTPSGSSFTQSVPLTGSGTNTPPPPPPPAVIYLTDNEPIAVKDSLSFPDVFDPESITVKDQVTIQVLNATSTSISISGGSVYGTPTNVTVSVSSSTATVTGNVTLSVDGGTPITMALSSGSSTFNLGILKAGSHALAANFPAQGTFIGSSAQATLVISPATPTITWANPSPITYGTALSGSQLNATASVPGAFVYSPAAGTILGAGTSTLTVSFTPSDSSDYSAVSAKVSITVNKAASTTNLSSSPNPSTDQAVTLTATIVPQLGGVATGSVTFTDSVAGNLGTAAVAGNVATLSTTALTSIGKHSIVATYNGDSNVLASTSATLTQTVNALATTTTLVSSANPSYITQQVTFTATVMASNGTPATGTVTFKQGTTALSTVPLTNGVATYSVTFLTVGSRTFTAVYAANGPFLGSTSTALTQITIRIPTTISISPLPASIPYPGPITLQATVVSSAGLTVNGGVVAFSVARLTSGTCNVTVPLLTVASGTVSSAPLSVCAATYSVSATYRGDTTFLPSTTTTATTFTVAQAPTSVTVVPSEILESGTPVTFTATVTSSAGVPSGQVTFLVNKNFLAYGMLTKGVAKHTDSNLPIGQDSIVVSYQGSANFAPSTSAPAIVTAEPRTVNGVTYRFPIDFPRASQTQLMGINDSDVIAGFYKDASNTTHGLSGTYGSFTSFDVPFPTAVLTAGFGIANNGTIVGRYLDGAGEHGFVYVYASSGFRSVDAPALNCVISPLCASTQSALNTDLLAVDALSGDTTGVFTDASGHKQGFLISSAQETFLLSPNQIPFGTVNNLTVGLSGDDAKARDVVGTMVGNSVPTQTIVFPGATLTIPSGVNSSLSIVGSFLDAAGVRHGFVDQGGNYMQVDIPGAINTSVTGVNNLGRIVGFYQDAQGIHGFLATASIAVAARYAFVTNNGCTYDAKTGINSCSLTLTNFSNNPAYATTPVTYSGPFEITFDPKDYPNNSLVNPSGTYVDMLTGDSDTYFTLQAGTLAPGKSVNFTLAVSGNPSTATSFGIFSNAYAGIF